MKFCPECGNELPESAKFCLECGFKVVNTNMVHTYNEKSLNNVKVSSEQYIKKVLFESHLNNVLVVPDIPEKKLINASVSIADNIDPTTIIALMDQSTLSNAKAGIVFTGDSMYIKSNFGNSEKISFKNIISADYDTEISTNNRGKVTESEYLNIKYTNGDSIKINIEEYGKNFPYKLLGDLLDNFHNSVDIISARSQVIQLNNMNSDIITIYFRIIIAYLKDDDGIIDSREYKELITLMTKVKVTKSVAETLRDFRFENKEHLSIEELISKLINQLNEENISETTVLQSLGMDIIGMNNDRLDEISTDQVLKRMLNRLNITDEQIKFTVRKIRAEKEILENRLTDSQIKDVVKELTAVASGAGISLGALAVTGAVTGWGGISGGMLALGLSTGGAVVGVAAIASAGYGVYRGVKYFSGTSQLEQFGIRIETLTDRISQLRIANTYIIEDINWLSNKLVEFSKKLKETNELSNELFVELEFIINQNQSLVQAGSLIEKEEEFSEYELTLTAIPEELNIGKYNESLDININKVHYDEVVKSIYVIDGDLDESEGKSAFLKENIALDNLKTLQNILEEIGYFDTKSSSIAQGKSIAKKGLSGLKKSFFTGE